MGLYFVVRLLWKKGLNNMIYINSYGDAFNIKQSDLIHLKIDSKYADKTQIELLIKTVERTVSMNIEYISPKEGEKLIEYIIERLITNCSLTRWEMFKEGL